MKLLGVRTITVFAVLAGAALGCKSKSNDASPPADKPVPSPTEGSAAGSAPTPPAPNANGSALVLDDKGIGELREGFTGGVAELGKALPGLTVTALGDTDNEGMGGYRVARDGTELFTLTPADGDVYLKAQAPGLTTSDGLQVGSTFEELAAVKRKRECTTSDEVGPDAVAAFLAVCRFEGGTIAYELAFDAEAEPAQSGPDLEKLLAGKKVTAIKWKTSAKLSP